MSDNQSSANAQVLRERAVEITRAITSAFSAPIHVVLVLWDPRDDAFVSAGTVPRGSMCELLRAAADVMEAEQRSSEAKTPPIS